MILRSATSCAPARVFQAHGLGATQRRMRRNDPGRRCCYASRHSGMADIFLSYAREDRHIAEQLAHALEHRGWTVWWDRRIGVGKSFSQVIERELDACKCVVVLWSTDSVASDWVLAEASEGLRRKILVPALITIDVRVPLEFRRIHAADMVQWPAANGGFNECLDAMRELVPSPASSVTSDSGGRFQERSAVITAPETVRQRPSTLPIVNRILPDDRSISRPPARGIAEIKPALGNKVNVPMAAPTSLRSTRTQPVNRGTPYNLPPRPPTHEVSRTESHHKRRLRRAGVTSPMERHQPLLWSAAQSTRYFTGQHPSVGGSLVAVLFILLWSILLVLWSEGEHGKAATKHFFNAAPRVKMAPAAPPNRRPASVVKGHER